MKIWMVGEEWTAHLLTTEMSGGSLYVNGAPRGRRHCRRHHVQRSPSYLYLV